jgi:hypothetical protein
VKLFDDFERTELRPSFKTEPSFVYINQTGRTVFARVRVLMEDWFSHYPAAGQIELRNRFRSSEDRIHRSAFFELALHELFFQLRCQVVIHPFEQITDGAKSPDYEVTDPEGESSYVEARLTYGESIHEEKTQALIDTVLDGINRKLKSNDFFIGIEMEGAPKTAPSIEKIVGFLKGQLRGLDPDDPELASDNGPTWPYEHDGWHVGFFPIPKLEEARGEPTDQVIGLQSTGVRPVDDRTSIKRAIIKKATRYGELNKPYIIAVNVLGGYAEEKDVVDALFGQEQVTVWFSKANPGEPTRSQLTRARDGAWIGPKGLINSRVSGVLIFHHLNFYTIPRARVCLYHHPKAQRPYSSVLTRLPQAIVRDNRLVRIEGMSLHEVFNLPEAWPEEYSGQERTESLL